ncbi:MAG: IclR family transcriptional regulator [Sandaracinaceae bacterium]
MVRSDSEATGATLRSVRNALRILRQFSATEPLLGVSELARRLGVAKSTTHRLLATLTAEGFVRQVPDGRYGLGFVLWELGSQLVGGLELREVAHPILEELRNRTGETVHLAVLDETEVVYIDRFESPATLQLFRRVGFRMPAHSTSTGKAILAFSPSSVVDRVVAEGLRRLTDTTITREADLRSRLADVAARGYVLSRGESEVGVTSLGAPIFDFEGRVVGAVSVAGPDTRMGDAVLEGLVAEVRGAAAKISRGMGYAPKDR